MPPTPAVPDSSIHPLRTVTPVSKYLAMVLFIILPFLGGYIGYMFAPEKVVEVEKQTIIKSTNVDAEAVNPFNALSQSNMYQIPDIHIEGYDDQYLLVDIVPEGVSGFTNLYEVKAQPDGHKQHTLLFSSTQLSDETWNLFAPAFNESKTKVEFSYMSCFSCGIHGKLPAVVAVLDPINISHTVKSLKLGPVAFFEWLTDAEFRYKVWPAENHPEYKYVFEDRVTGDDCGMGGCPIENIDWDTIEWQYGEI